MNDAGELSALRATLERRFRTVKTPVAVGEDEVEILHPANADDLISEADFVKDERLPYWADLWPSSLILASIVADEPGTGRRLLELGCGSGLVTTAAAMARFETTATDYYEDALLFARVNAWHNTGADVRVRHLDWREFPNDLGTFDLVVASDVLYERAYGALVAQAYARTIATRGRGLLADPGRLAVPEFLDECERLELEVKKIDRVPYAVGEIRQTIDIYEMRW